MTLELSNRHQIMKIDKSMSPGVVCDLIDVTYECALGLPSNELQTRITEEDLYWGYKQFGCCQALLCNLTTGKYCLEGFQRRV